MRLHWKSWHALTVPLPALIVPLPVSRFLNKLATKVSKDILRNFTFCSYVSFLIALLMLLIKSPDSSNDLITFRISFISLLEIINVVLPDPNIFLWIAASVADAAAVNPDGIKTLLANGLSTFLIKGKPVFGNCPKTLPKNPRDCPILCNWVFDNFILADKLFAKALSSLETWVLANNNLWGKLFALLESPTTFEEILSYVSTIFYSRF